MKQDRVYIIVRVSENDREIDSVYYDEHLAYEEAALLNKGFRHYPYVVYEYEVF